jgi:hypothetical protein
MSHHRFVAYVCLLIVTTQTIATVPDDVPIAGTRSMTRQLDQLQVGEVADLLGTTVPASIGPSTPICSLSVRDFHELVTSTRDPVLVDPVSTTPCKWSLQGDWTTNKHRFITLHAYCDTGHGFLQTTSRLLIARSDDQFLVRITYATREGATATVTTLTSDNRNSRAEGGLSSSWVDGNATRSTHISLHNEGRSFPIVFHLTSNLVAPLSIEFPPVPDPSEEACDLPEGYECSPEGNGLVGDQTSVMDYTGYAAPEELVVVIPNAPGTCAWKLSNDVVYYQIPWRYIEMTLYCDSKTGSTGTGTKLMLWLKSDKSTLTLRSERLNEQDHPVRFNYEHTSADAQEWAKGVAFEDTNGDMTHTYARLSGDGQVSGISLHLVSELFGNMSAHFPVLTHSDSCDVPTGYVCKPHGIHLDQLHESRTYHFQ